MSPAFWTGLTFCYHILGRLAYVVGVGTMLRRQDRDQVFTKTAGVEAGFARFRRAASAIMNHDGFTFVLLCVVTRGSLPGFAPVPWPQIAGAVLCLVGIGVKSWAARSIGMGAYYWRNFFDPTETAPHEPTGPYRYISNPMYTVGNLHLYGLALLTSSLPGLIAAVFDQAALMVFNAVVERPHFRRLTRRG